MKAFWVSDCEIWAANDAEEARADYLNYTGESVDEDYFAEVTDEALDDPFPDIDENELPTGRSTTLRELLKEYSEPGFLAGTE